ncbi:DMT family transporter [Chachezhania antarctica]|uniref:DMT family transporter n=1 Tax=Chachezhania antarctica TaxID=2340860 RepID=UPI000EAFEB9F|nr:DMT family transporter [Chachezhania antarctica]|tara:strand:+ start:1906 stop:2811 length:906 start_codon:yes stop_codon:yes gene_type:complete
MSLWIPVSIAAALFQTLRFMLQKWLSTARLSAEGATFARFAYSAPFLLVLLTGWFVLTGHAVPHLNLSFWAFALSGGAAQILATVFVVLLFKSRNFAVGMTFKNSEVMQAAMVGFVLLGDRISWGGFVAILLSVGAIFLLSRPPEGTGSLWQNLTNRASGLGLGAGFLFAVSAVGYRGAAMQIDDPSAVLRAAMTLTAVTTSQMIGMALWIFWRDRTQLRAVWEARSSAVWIGLTSVAGSFCWFLAFTLQTAAYVKAVGQVELVFSLIASVLFFREKISAREMAGIALLGLSILILILSIQ